MDKISVIVPVYNAGKYLSRCVDSILSQTYCNFELILIDDGSTDASFEMCNKIRENDSRVRLFHKENGGHASARNKGIDLSFESDAEWITFIDSDDWINANYLEYLLQAARETGTNISMCSYERVGIDDRPQHFDYCVFEVEPETLWCEKRTNSTLPCGKLYHKSIFNDIRWPQKCHDDEHMTYKLLFANPKIAFVDAPLYRYYYNTNSVMASGWSLKHIDSVDAICERREYFKRNGYKRAYDFDCKLYIEELYNTLQELEKISDRPNNTYLSFQKAFRREMQTNAQKYGFTWRKYKYMYIYAFPVLRLPAIVEHKVSKFLRRNECE